MKKILQKYLVIVASILLIFFLLEKINWLPSFRNIFKSQPVLIEKTPIIIQEINKLAQLITVTYADEVVMDTIKQSSGMPSLISTGAGMMLLPSNDKLL